MDAFIRAWNRLFYGNGFLLVINILILIFCCAMAVGAMELIYAVLRWIGGIQ